MRYPTLPEILRERIKEPATLAYRFLADGTSDSAVDWTYHDLARHAEAVAARLGDAQGRRVVLALDPGLHYLAGLFGIFQAGATAVPSFPPFGRKARSRFVAIINDCKPDVVMVSAHLAEEARSLEPEFRTPVTWLPVDEDFFAAHTWPVEEAPLRVHDPACLQYTSGSTGDPKGIAVTHANLVSNCRAIEANMGPDAQRVGCSWLPPYHDMGLMGTIMLALHGGWPLVLLSPVHFVQHPYRWLKAISDHRVTISVGPNFAFDMCVETVTGEELTTLDLSTLRQVYCGSEPVLKATLDRFRDRFAPCGYREWAVVPCYGLAEATLFVAGKPDGTEVRTHWLDKAALEQGQVRPGDAWGDEAVEIVSCGAVAEEHEVVIVDPETLLPVSAGEVGEIWVAGPNVASGYFQRPEASAATFSAAPATDPDSDTRYLRTGDLGFLRAGELCVTGRIKDLVIIAGRNLYPQDIELSVLTACEELRRAVAFGYSGGGPEELVVVAEFKRAARRTASEMAAVREAAVMAVAADHAVRLCDIHFGPAGTIPVTTSGKVRRDATKTAYRTGTLKRLALEETTLSAP